MSSTACAAKHAASKRPRHSKHGLPSTATTLTHARRTRRGKGSPRALRASRTSSDASSRSSRTPSTSSLRPEVCWQHMARQIRISAEEVADITKGARQAINKAGAKAPKNLGQAVRSALKEAVHANDGAWHQGVSSHGAPRTRHSRPGRRPQDAGRDSPNGEAIVVVSADVSFG